MFSLVYTSDERIAFDEASLAELGELSSARNYANAITGYLSWKEGRFFQFLEGEEATVRALMDAIRADPRHAVGPVLELCAWEERRFSDWDMCFLDPPAPSQARIQDVVGRAIGELRAPGAVEAGGREPILGMIERMGELVRENDLVDG